MKNYLSFLLLIGAVIILALILINPFAKMLTKAIHNIDRCNTIYDNIELY